MPNTTNKIDFFTRKIMYVCLQSYIKLVYLLSYLYSILHQKKSSASEVKRIATVWYTPPDRTGDELRMGYYQRFFKEDGYIYDSFYIGKMAEHTAEYENGTWTQRYFYFIKVFHRRFRQFLKLKDYDVVWLKRGFIPYYKLQRGFFERCLKRMGVRLVIDTCDGGDYQLNPPLVEDTFALADRITVGYLSLKRFYDPKYASVSHIEWAVPSEKYSVKKDYKFSGVPVVGWMGSPYNFEFVKDIEAELQKAAGLCKFKFVYICRTPQNISIPNAEVEFHKFGDDYFDLLASFDIGISPFTQADFSTEGKIAMKHQEFLLMATPQVCSNIAISDFAVHNEHCLIAKSVSEWHEQLLRLLQDEKLRERLGKKSRDLFLNHYTYESEYPKLREALTKF